METDLTQIGTPTGGDDAHARLVVLDGKAHANTVEISSEQLSIGRQQQNGLVLVSENVSRKHARITRDHTRYFVEDLNSSNGTYLNGARVQPGMRHALRHKDVLQLSDCRLLFLDLGGFATSLGLDSIQLDHEQVRREADRAIDAFLRDGTEPTS